MTQEDFFGAIEHNLQQLAARRERLPPCGWRVGGYRCVTREDACCPRNVRCYDLVSMKPLFGEPEFFRVFACYADESTGDGYRAAKFTVRKWYQESGWSASSERPSAAAMVVGAASAWEQGLVPNADDMPCGNVAFRMLVASRPGPKGGILTEKNGDWGSYVSVCQALVPETFDNVERRVRDCVEGLFLPNGEVVGGGFLTVRRVMDELPMLPGDFIAHVFEKLQAEGKYTIGELPSAEGRETFEARRYIKKGPPRSCKWLFLAIFLGMLTLCLLLWFLFLLR